MTVPVVPPPCKHCGEAGTFSIHDVNDRGVTTVTRTWHFDSGTVITKSITNHVYEPAS